MSTTNTARPTPTPAATPAKNRPRPRVPRFGLSVTQLIATALAAVTATVAASYFGVAGTVLGAALVSVVTAAGKEVYSQSLRSTGQRVRAVVPVTRSLPVTPEPAGAATDSAASAATAAPPDLPARGSRRVAPPLPWRRITMGTVAMFVAVLAVITGVEIVAGRPVSDIVRGDSGAGTSVFGGQTVRTKTVPPTAPTVTLTVTPKVVVTTPTVTQTAPPSTATTTPTTTTTPSSSTAPSSPTGTPSSSAGTNTGSVTPSARP